MEIKKRGRPSKAEMEAKAKKEAKEARAREKAEALKPEKVTTVTETSIGEKLQSIIGDAVETPVSVPEVDTTEYNAVFKGISRDALKTYFTKDVMVEALRKVFEAMTGSRLTNSKVSQNVVLKFDDVYYFFVFDSKFNEKKGSIMYNMEISAKKTKIDAFVDGKVDFLNFEYDIVNYIYENQTLIVTVNAPRGKKIYKFS